MELVTQIDTLGPNAWQGVGGIGHFWQHYAPWSGVIVNGKKVGRISTNDLDLKNRMHNSFMFRRKRDEVIDLPSKTRTTVVLEGTGTAVDDYIACENDLIAWLESLDKDTTGAERAYALVRLGFLRKHVGKAKVESIIKFVSEILDNEPGGVFIVAEHVDTMDSLVAGLSKYKVCEVRGGMSESAKHKAVNDFNSGASRVMVGQIISAGTGLTLTGNGINVNHRTIIAQLPWNPASLKQAEDRVHRISQSMDVCVTIPLCHIEGRQTIDERLWGVLEDKAFSTGILIDGEAEVLLETIQNGVLDSYKRKKVNP
jgi:SNF2 family DNA or RNA helicase